MATSTARTRKPTALDLLKAEAEAEDGLLTGTLAGRPVHIRPPAEWRSSARSALRSGDYELWAEKCLPAASLEVWREVDPKVSEIVELFESFSAESPGK